jgi:hypothetical protein
MRQVFLAAPDTRFLSELGEVVGAWLRQRCITTCETSDAISWQVSLNLNAFFIDKGSGEKVLGSRMNDTIGGEIGAGPPAKKKRQKRKVLNDAELKKLEADQNWRRMMAGPEQPEQEKRPDSFRYQEREQYDEK